MRLLPLILLGSLVAVVGAEVRVEPPSPYMSSPPPVEADTTVIDPGRKPNCETQPGLTEAWYGDWNLTTDRPSTKPLEIKAPRRGAATYRVAFDDNGWPTEVTYFDVKSRLRWTKLFRYPARIPAGPGEVPYQWNWIGANGKAILMNKVAEAFAAGKWEIGMKKYEIGDVMGEPLLVEVTSAGTMFSANAETWVYWVDREVRFTFDKDNRLIALPLQGPVPVAAKPDTVRVVVDTVKRAVVPPESKPEKASDSKKSKAKPAATKPAKPVADTAAPVTDTAKVAPVPKAAKPVADTTKPAAAVKPAVDTAKPVPPKPTYRSKSKLVTDTPKAK